MKNNMEWVSLLVAVVLSGFFTTVVVQFLKNCRWPDGVKVVLTIVVASVIGVAQLWVTGDLLGFFDRWGSLTAADFVAIFGSVLAGSLLWYNTWLRDAPWMKKLLTAIWGCPPEDRFR